jgi:hypothetical protein
MLKLGGKDNWGKQPGIDKSVRIFWRNIWPKKGCFASGDDDDDDDDDEE